MPKLMTTEYLERTFFVPYKADKSEGVYVRPLSATVRNTIRDNAIQEAGHDRAIADDVMLHHTLSACIVDWCGFFDAVGNEIKYSKDMLKELILHEPQFFQELLLRVSRVAHFGELEQEKN